MAEDGSHFFAKNLRGDYEILFKHIFENAHHRGSDECSEKVELELRMAENEALLSRRGQALLLLDTDHAPGLHWRTSLTVIVLMAYV